MLFVIGKAKRIQNNSIEVFPSMRIKVPAYPPYRYPDLSALCGKVEIETLGKQELPVNPQLIIEILSDSTADFDQGDKFTYYKSIESFTEYILIAQHRPKVTQFIKQSDNSWLQHEFTDLSDSFHLDSLDCEIGLLEIYENVEFPERSTRFDLISVRNNRHLSNITVVLLRFSLFQQAFVRFARSSHVHLWRGQFQNICTRAF